MAVCCGLGVNWPGPAFPVYPNKALMANPDRELMTLVKAILDGDAERISATIGALPELTIACFQMGATRASAKPLAFTVRSYSPIGNSVNL